MKFPSRSPGRVACSARTPAPPSPTPPSPPSPPAPPANPHCKLENDTDFEGHDLPPSSGRWTGVTNASECCQLCRHAPHCTAFTFYVFDEATSGRGVCYGKTSSAGRRPLPNTISGTVLGPKPPPLPPTPPPSPRACGLMPNVGIAGRNLAWDGPGRQPKDCCEGCQHTNGCNAAVHYEYGPTGESGGFCYYKAEDQEVPYSPGSTAVIPGKSPPPPPPPPVPIPPVPAHCASWYDRTDKHNATAFRNVKAFGAMCLW